MFKRSSHGFAIQHWGGVCSRKGGWGVPGRIYVSDNWERTETERDVARVLEEVAAEVGAQSIQAGTSSQHYAPF